MFSKNVSDDAKQLVRESIPNVSGVGNRLFFTDELGTHEFIVRASERTHKPVVLANNIHYLDWMPMVHIIGDEVRVFSAKEIVDRGRFQHGVETMNIQIDLEVDKPSLNPYFSLVKAFNHTEGTARLRDILRMETENVRLAQEAVKRLVAMHKHPSAGW